ncbi:MAG: hypothetical protein K8T90_01810 [Planctomycetes bacterium]|nr:hypothetical protein [Planctomycetota bacterium]
MYERRLLRMFFGVAALLAVVLCRAFWVQVVSADEIIRRNDRVLRSTSIAPALRGEVLWADGTPAVRNSSRWTIRLDRRAFTAERYRCARCGEILTRSVKTVKSGTPTRSPAPAGPVAPDPLPPCAECGAPAAWERLPPPDMQALATLLQMRRDELQSKVDAAIARAELLGWKTVDLFETSRISVEQAMAIAVRSADIPGVMVRSEPWRETDPAIAKIAGRTHLAWESDVKELMNAERDAAGLHRYTYDEATRTLVGESGFERHFNDSLSGVPGLTERPMARPGEPRQKPVVVVPPVDGTPIRTTLRRDVQTVAAAIVERSSAKCATAIVLDLADGADGAVVAAVTKSDDPYSHVITPIAPGSVFKLVTALAWLESGGSPDATVDCAMTGVTVHRRRYTCTGTHPGVALLDAFGKSCNCYFMTRAEDAGAAAMADAYTRLGMDLQSSLRIGVAPRVTKMPDFSLHTALLGIGQAEALSTPMQIATAYARLATGGRRIVPYIDRDVGPAPESREVDPVIAQYADLLREGARRTVRIGTGAGVPLLAEIDAAGKSGTAEILVSRDPLTKVEKRTMNAWFVGYAPASAPRYVAVVVHERVAEHGGHLAGPHVAELLEAALRER